MKKYIILIILAILLIPSIVNADEYFYDGGYIGTSYIKKIRSDGSGKYKRMRSILRKSDNKLSYCIAPWANIDEEAPYRIVSSIPDISNNTLERIKLISYYGLGYNNHTDDIWYAVTQLLIWREVDPSSTFFFTSTLNGDYTDKYDSYFNEVLNLVNNHKFKLDTNEVSLMVREPYTINVLEGDLSNFDIIDNNHIVRGIYGNNKIEIKTEYGGDFYITLKRKPNYNESVLIYQSDTSQDMLVQGNIDEEYTIKVNSYYGEATVYKKDKDTGTNPQGDALLEGTKLILSGPQIGEIVTMDETLVYKWDTLPYGHYTIYEYEPNEGYEMNHIGFSFDITTSSMKHEFVLENEVIKNVVHIHKTYNNIWNEYINEEGITFEIYYKDSLYTTCTTNKDGLINIELPYGTYIFHQVNSKEGYSKVDDFEIIIKDSTEYIEYELVNELKEGTLLIHKYYGNESNKKVEPDIEFEIYNNDKLYTTVKTNKEGTINIDIPYGTYLLHQVTSKYGYYNVEDLEFTINDDNTEIVLDLLDKEIKYTLTISKKDLSTNMLINTDEIEFLIYNEDNKYKITTIDGIASIELPMGNYSIKEINPSIGYILNEDIVTINLDKDTSIDFYNSKIEVPDTKSNYSYINILFMYLFFIIKRIKRYS